MSLTLRKLGAKIFMSDIKTKIENNSFLIFCSGASKQILQECPISDINRCISLGLLVLMTAIFASISGGYAFYFIFKSTILALIFGMIWGFMIFCLDRYFVLSMIKSGGNFKELFLAFPRIILAIIIGFVISRPIELRLFQDEIDQHLADKREFQILETDSLYEGKIQSVNLLFASKEEVLIITRDTLKEKERKEVSNWKIQLKEYQNIRNDAFDSYKCECDGTCGTGNKGNGSECKRKKGHYEKAQLEFESQREIVNKSISLIEKKIFSDDSILELFMAKLALERDSLVNKIRLQKESHKEDLKQKFATSFLARNTALTELSKKEGSVENVSRLIILLFIIIETSPVLTKLISPKSSYDFLQSKEILQTKLQRKRKRAESKIKFHWRKRSLLEQILLTHKKRMDVRLNKVKALVKLKKLEKAVLEWKRQQFESQEFLKKLDEELNKNISSFDGNLFTKKAEPTEMNGSKSPENIASENLEEKDSISQETEISKFQKLLESKLFFISFVLSVLVIVFVILKNKFKVDFQIWNIALTLILTIITTVLNYALKQEKE